MANNPQTIQSGSGELKNFYDDSSTYEAIKRRRKKAAEKSGIDETPDYDWNEVPDPNK